MGTNIVGHVKFWENVLAEMNIKMCESFRLVPLKEDKSLAYNAKRTSMPENKLKRSAKLRDIIIKEMKQESEAVKEGKTYQSGSAIEIKSAKAIVSEMFKLNR